MLERFVARDKNFKSGLLNFYTQKRPYIHVSDIWKPDKSLFGEGHNKIPRVVPANGTLPWDRTDGMFHILFFSCILVMNGPDILNARAWVP